MHNFTVHCSTTWKTIGGFATEDEAGAALRRFERRHPDLSAAIIESDEHRKRREESEAAVRARAREMMGATGRQVTGHKSNYARKMEYLRPRGLFGFQVPEPKPWKAAGVGV